MRVRYGMSSFINKLKRTCKLRAFSVSAIALILKKGIVSFKKKYNQIDWFHDDKRVHHFYAITLKFIFILLYHNAILADRNISLKL